MVVGAAEWRQCWAPVMQEAKVVAVNYEAVTAFMRVVNARRRTRRRKVEVVRRKREKKDEDEDKDEKKDEA